MTSEIAAMLDELMGRGRNEEAGKQTQRVDYKDPEVCHYYVCGFCPHELFVNTRADLGPCKKIHDEAIRKEYQTSEDVFKLGYEEKFYDFLTDCVVEVERRIKRNKMRLDQTNGGRQQEDTPESAEATERLAQLQIEISNLLLEVESLGEQGEVQQAMAKTAHIDKLKEERERIRQRNSANIQAEPQTFNGIQEKQMEVCEICGSFLIVGDAQARVDDHLMGKQHMGYARMRAKIAEYKDVIEKKRNSRRSSRTDSRRSEEKSSDSRDTRTDRRDSRTEHSDRSNRYDRTDDRHRSDYRDRQKDRRRSSDRSRSDRERDRHRRYDDDRRDHREKHHRRRRSRSRSGDRRKEDRRSSKGYHRENGTSR